MTRYVIIGDGGAGTTAAYYIRQADPSGRVEMYSDDANAAYYRAALTNYLIGELRETQLFAVPPDFYQANKIERSLGRVAALEAGNSRFRLEDGKEVTYDQLLIAAGASPNKPAFTGADTRGVMTMRTLQDARTVMDMISAKRLRQAVVVGGGPLGIEWVQGLLHHHVHVTYLLRGDMFFEKALDRTASDLVISRLRAAGVDVRLNEEVGEAIAGKDGRLRAIRLKNSGAQIECQLLGAAIGIRPNVDFLKDSGVDVAVDEKRGTPQGIKVDGAMRSNIPNIYAAGDIIHRTLGLWEPARLQGRIAGSNMAGGSASFRQSVHYNATRLYDLDFAGIGDPQEKTGDQVLIDFPRGSGRVRYLKLIVRGGKLVGAVMLGQRKEHVRKYGMQYRKLIEDQTDISSVADILLDPSFDLASWMDSQELGDQINSARKISEATQAPSIAEMRQVRPESTTGLRASKGPSISMNVEAVLLKDGNKIPLKTVTRIGRKAENELVLDDNEASGKHAQILRRGNGYLLEDLGSTNGTFLDGQRILAPTQLASGAVIKIGQTQLQFMGATSAQNQSVQMTSIGLPEAAPAPAAQPSDPIWGTLQLDGREFPLRMASINVGRDAKADITLDDPTISFIHAQLVLQGDAGYLRDLGSRNGTFVNGARISVPHPLIHGDVIKLGGTTLVFRTGTAAAPADALHKAEAIVHPVKEETGVQAEVEAVAAPSPVVEKSIEAIKPLKLSLIVRNGDLSGKIFQLMKSPTTLGRNPANHIVIRHETASWNHATFNHENMQWYVRDMGSSNGTRLNDIRLEPNQPYPLQIGDQLKFGETLLEVTQDAG